MQQGMNRQKAAPMVRLARVSEILSLRNSILRPDVPLDTNITGDHAADTLHAGAFDGSDCVAAGTLVREALDGENAYRLRGMAVHPDYRGEGLGRAVLALLFERGRAGGVNLFWCNARAPAAGFYLRLGWQIRSDIFEIPGIGPHYRMRFCRAEIA